MRALGVDMNSARETEPLRNAGLAVITLGVVVTGLVYGRSSSCRWPSQSFSGARLEAMIQGLPTFQWANTDRRVGLPPCWGLAVVATAFYLIATILLGQADAIAAASATLCGPFRNDWSDPPQWPGPEIRESSRKRRRDHLTRQIPGFLFNQSVILSVLPVIAYIAFLGGRPKPARENAAIFLMRCALPARLFTSIS